MSSSLQDVGYRHWNGTVENIWVRRATVARHTMRSCLRGKVIRILVVIPWVLALMAATVYFGIGQILVPEGLMTPLINLMGPQMQTLADGITAWLALYPDITVRAVAKFLTSYLAGLTQTVSFIIITLIIPRLLTRDIASHAIVVYSSRAISRFDYLASKLAGLLGILTLSWLGPVLTAWFLGNVVAPDWAFFWHSRAALINAILFIAPSMVVVALVALAISAPSAKGRIAVGVWLAFWLLTLPLVPIAKISQGWLAHFSISFNLDRLSVAIFSPFQDFADARDSLPFFNSVFGNLPADRIQEWGTANAMGPAIGLAVMAGLAVLILFRRIQAR